MAGGEGPAQGADGQGHEASGVQGLDGAGQDEASAACFTVDEFRIRLGSRRRRTENENRWHFSRCQPAAYMVGITISSCFNIDEKLTSHMKPFF